MNTSPITTVQVNLDAQGEIDEDLYCFNCQYNLRKILPTENCPECGKPIVLSLDSRWLHLRDPKWLTGLRAGCIALFISTAISFFVSIGLIYSMTNSYINEDFLNLFLPLLRLFIMLGLGYGSFQLTTPDMAIRLDSQINIYSSVARAGLVCFSISHGVIIIGVISMWFDSDLVIHTTLPLGIVGCVGFWALSMHGSRLAKWIPDPLLVKACKVAAWCFLLIGILLLAVIIEPILLQTPVFLMSLGGYDRQITYFMLIVLFATYALSFLLIILYYRRLSRAIHKSDLRKQNELTRLRQSIRRPER